jgi:hypothetical protein
LSTSDASGEDPQGENQQLEPELGVHRVALLGRKVLLPAGPVAGGLGDG